MVNASMKKVFARPPSHETATLHQKHREDRWTIRSGRAGTTSPETTRKIERYACNPARMGVYASNG